jgi:para-nitrobenzyl esterase
VTGSASQITGEQPLYDGAALSAAGNAVVVTLDYRLGALGFLALTSLAAESAHASSGNYGLLDQIAALEWVQRNIQGFGGDPDRVLVFGESAGAVDTCALVSSPLAAGLFSAALMQSGACAAATHSDRQEEGAVLVTSAGCGDAPDELACLRALSAEEVLRARPGMVSVEALGVGTYGPNVDGWVLPRAPIQQIMLGEHNHVPFVVGVNADETGRSSGPVPDEDAYRMLIRTTFGPFGADDEVLAMYPASDYATPREAWVRVMSDSKFICNARRAARAAAAGQTEPVYRYYFTHRLSGMAGRFGAFHGLEIVFVFQHLGARASGYMPTAADLTVQRALGAYWTSLAASGEPTPGDTGAPEWPQYDADRDNHLVIGDPITVGEGVRTEHCDFWDALTAAGP